MIDICDGNNSTVRHTYPSAVPGCSDDWFAEHMLPEGAHNHALDWTVMFLNRDQKSLDEDWPKRFGEENEDGDEAGTRVALEKVRFCLGERVFLFGE